MLTVCIMTDEEVIRAAMRLLGQRTSPRKTESSRANAKRPRKRKSEHTNKVCSTPNKPID